MVDFRKIFSQRNTKWNKRYFLEILAISRNLQNILNMMSATVSKEFFNPNNNVKRVEFRDMDTFIQSMRKSQIITDITFL